MSSVRYIKKNNGSVVFRDDDNRIIFVAPETSEIEPVILSPTGDYNAIKVTTPAGRSAQMEVNLRIKFDDGVETNEIGEDTLDPNYEFHEFIVYDIMDYLLSRYFTGSPEEDIANNVTNNITVSGAGGGLESPSSFLLTGM